MKDNLEIINVITDKVLAYRPNRLRYSEEYVRAGCPDWPTHWATLPMAMLAESSLTDPSVLQSLPQGSLRLLRQQQRHKKHIE